MPTRYFVAIAGVLVTLQGVAFEWIDSNAFSRSVLAIGLALVSGGLWREIRPVGAEVLGVAFACAAWMGTTAVAGAMEFEKKRTVARVSLQQQQPRDRMQAKDVRARKSRRNRKRRRSIRVSVRFELMRRADYRCEMCGARARGNSGVELHIDHKVPVAHGGTNAIDNLWVLCRDCNLGKGVRRL